MCVSPIRILTKNEQMACPKMKSVNTCAMRGFRPREVQSRGERGAGRRAERRLALQEPDEVVRRAFRAFDSGAKGYISGYDLERVMQTVAPHLPRAPLCAPRLATHPARAPLLGDPNFARNQAKEAKGREGP